MREFQEFRGSLKFALTAERPVEGDHAKFHKRGRIAHGHSVRFMSFVRRVGELQCHNSQNPRMLFQLGGYMAQHITALQMIAALGLMGPPQHGHC